MLWTLRRGEKTLRCELRDDTRVSAGWDVQLLEADDFLAFAQRCPTEPAAQFLAASLKREKRLDGWTDPPKTILRT